VRGEKIPRKQREISIETGARERGGKEEEGGRGKNRKKGRLNVMFALENAKHNGKNLRKKNELKRGIISSQKRQYRGRR